MADAAELLVRLANLEKIRDSGVLRLRHGEGETLFRDFADLEKAIAALKAELAALGTSARRIRSIRVNSRSAW